MTQPQTTDSDVRQESRNGLDTEQSAQPSLLRLIIFMNEEENWRDNKVIVLY